MREQHALVGDRDDIVVEGAGGDRLLPTARRRSPGAGSSRCSRAIALDASRCCRAGKAPARHAIDEHLDARLAVRRGAAACGWPRLRRRTPAGPAHAPRMHRCAKASRSCASVAGHSWLRCGMVLRLATVRWHLPSAVSGAGETVAALAAHIAEADMALAASTGSASSIVVPSSASQARSGRGCGRKMPWARPSARLARILSMPWSAAARGCDTSPALRVEARLPRLRPA